MKLLTPQLLLFSTLFFSLAFSTPGATQTVTDIDGNTYPTVVIGPYEWMAENLRTTRFNNGDEIPQVVDYSTWETTPDPAWSWYNNNGSYDQNFGKLYIGHVVLDNRNVCPEGWHVPSDYQWREMLFTLCETGDCEDVWLQGEPQPGWMGTDEGGKVKSTSLWDSPNTGADNSSGLTVLPGGYRYFDGNYYTFGEYTNIWTTTMATDSINMFFWAPINDRADIYHGYGDPNNGQSIRCIRDAVTGTGEQNEDLFQLYPNPASHTLRLTTFESGFHEVAVYNVTGQILRSESFTSVNFVLDIADLPAGLYFIEVRSRQQVHSARWMKR